MFRHCATAVELRGVWDSTLGRARFEKEALMSRYAVACMALFVGAACATTPSVESSPAVSESVAPPVSEPCGTVEPAAETETSETPEADVAACIAECEQQSMARSVAWEKVQADCRASCSGEVEPLQETLTPDAER